MVRLLLLLHPSRTRRRRTRHRQSIARAWLFLLNNPPTVMLLPPPPPPPPRLLFPRIQSLPRSTPLRPCLRRQPRSILPGTITARPMVCVREKLRVRNKRAISVGRERPNVTKAGHLVVTAKKIICLAFTRRFLLTSMSPVPSRRVPPIPSNRTTDKKKRPSSCSIACSRWKIAWRNA